MSTSFHYRCPNCPQKLNADAKHVGLRARCPRCGEIHTVPGPDDPFLVGADDATRKIPPPPNLAAEQPAGPDPFAQFQKSTVGLSARPPEKASDAGGRMDGQSNVFRRCPACKRIIAVDNPWTGLICGHCGSEIPGN